jgi:TRAP-type mannitol/chloroaromatic compound transport system permease small subunit
MKKVVQVINSISEYSGRVVMWAVVALIVVLCYEVIARYAFNSPTIWALETSEMLGGVIGVLGWGYTYLHHGHVRVDVLYVRLPPRGKALVDVVMALIFLFPLVGILIFSGMSWAATSLATGEKMVESSWLPPAAPFRIVIAAGFCFFALQCVARFITDLHLLIKKSEL